MNHSGDPRNVIRFDVAGVEALGVSANGRERRPQVMTDAHQEVTLADPGSLQLGGHLVEGVTHLRQLVVARVGNPGCEVAVGVRPRRIPEPFEPSSEILAQRNGQDHCDDGPRGQGDQRGSGDDAHDRNVLDATDGHHDGATAVAELHALLRGQDGALADVDLDDAPLRCSDQSRDQDLRHIAHRRHPTAGLEDGGLDDVVPANECHVVQDGRHMPP